MPINRKALVIGNANYKVKPLDNPSNDASAIADILSDKGFSVCKKNDLKIEEFFSAIHDFCDKSKNADVVLLYFAGHGVEHEGENYLIPCDFDHENSLSYDAPKLDDIYNLLSKANSSSKKIFILDACRNDGDEDLLNLLTRSGGIGQGSIRVGQAKPSTMGDNTFIAFATAPGMKASDKGRGGENGLYTECLIEAISMYGMSIEELFRLVREKVIERNGFSQIPWEHSSLTSYFSFDNHDVPCNLIDTITLPFDTLYSSQFSQDSKSVFLAGSGGKILIHRFNSIQNIEISIGEEVHGEVLLLTDHYLLVGDTDGYLHSFGFKRKHQSKIHLFDSSIFGISSVSSDTVVVCSSHGILKEIDLDNDRVVATIHTGIKNAYCVKHIPTSDHNVLVGGDNYRLEIWDMDNGIRLRELDNKMFYTNELSFSHDRNVLATAHENGVVQIWDAKDFTLIRSVNFPEKVENIISVIEVSKESEKIPTNHIVSLSFSNDSNVLSVGTSEPSLEFIDVKYGKLIKKVKLDFPVSQVYSLCQSSDGDVLVCSGHKRKAYVFCTNKAMNM
ncbi:caspase family protein [Photobacterium damselae]|uniref:caspase family protein n=1 Tax=Photobacterium damselae TaxID=38293 RepID=UPI00406991D2